MNWEFYMNNYSDYGILGAGFIADESLHVDEPHIKVFVSISYDSSKSIMFIDKVGALV
jgi:hypothetical protein